MSTTPEQSSVSDRSSGTRQRSRLPIVIVLVLSLVVTALVQSYSHGRRDVLTNKQRGQVGPTGSTLSGMDSFALALLLGGLRGPLVMILWTSSESAKQERNLEGVNTQIEWIRLLQPEFDTVHVFQVWNKAYNLSVQMANLANKYTTILDAIDYAQNVLNERPNNITLTSSIASIYFDKLGNSAEKIFYRQRVRDETQPHPTRERLSRNDRAWTRLELDPLLDEQGMILPQYLIETRPRPQSVEPSSAWNNGAALQYLEPYQPFPQGVSAFALAFNYYRQAQVMQTVEGQRHIQSSDMVVDSRPPLALKNWSEDEWERGRRFEQRAFNITLPQSIERLELELPTSKMALGSAINDAKALDDAIYSYDMSARLTDDSITDYERHLAGFPGPNESTYLSHVAGLRAQGSLTRGDAAYLRVMKLPEGEAREGQLKIAREAYQRSIDEYRLIILKYYTDDQMIAATFPQGYFKVDQGNLKGVEKIPADQYGVIIERINALLARAADGYDGYAEDRGEYERYVQRALDRLNNLK